MKRKNNIIKFIVLMMFSVLILGCENIYSINENNEEGDFPTGTPTALVIITGNHNNSKKIEAPLSDKINDVYSLFGNIAIVVVDGEPSVIYNENGEVEGFYDSQYVERSKDNYKYQKIWKRDYLNKQVKHLTDVLNNCGATVNEVDTLGALQTAYDALNYIENSMEGEINKEIIICDTGLSTSGEVNFTDPKLCRLLEDDLKIENSIEKTEILDVLINELYTDLEIPDLNDVKVTWYGLGKVDDPQPTLSNLSINNLQYIWGSILNKAGAEQTDNQGKDDIFGFFVSVLTKDETKAYAPTVTPVIISTEYTKTEATAPISVITDDILVETTSEIESNESANNYENDFIIESPSLEKVYFKPGQSEFKSETDAANIVDLWSDYLTNQPNIDILLVGTTANFEGGSVILSEERAEKVYNLMLDNGVDAERIEIIGLGAKSPWHEDEWDNDDFIENIAQENRAVLILERNSERAKMLLNESKSGYDS